MQEIKEKVGKEEAVKKKKASEKAAATKKANAYSLKMKKHFNSLDGTFHMPDGTR